MEGDKDFANHNGTNGMPSLQQVKTEGSIVLTPEMFERMYLGPQPRGDGNLRKILGNPTPIGLGGFLIAYCPIIFSILGFRDFSGNGAATVGTYYFSGGLLAILTCIMEFILGNTFPSVFFGVFGAYFLAFGATLTPSFNAYIAYADPTATNPNLAAAEATMAPGFLSGLAFWNLMMAIFSLYCMICALRVNVLFFLAFLLLAITFTLISSSYWVVVQPGMAQMGHNLMIAGGSFGFVVIPIGWYLLLALMLTTVDFPLNLPVGDLSSVVPSATEMRKRKARSADVEKAE